MKEQLIGLGSDFALEAHKGLSEFDISDFPDDTKKVIAAAALFLIASSLNKLIRDKDYGDGFQRASDKIAATAGVFLGVITIAELD